MKKIVVKQGPPEYFPKFRDIIIDEIIDLISSLLPFIVLVALGIIAYIGCGDGHFDSRNEKTRIVRKYDTEENQYYYCAEYLDHGFIENVWKELKSTRSSDIKTVKFRLQGLLYKEEVIDE